MRKKLFSVTLVLLGFAMLLTACGGGTAGAPTTTAAAGTAAATTAAAGAAATDVAATTAAAVTTASGEAATTAATATTAAATSADAAAAGDGVSGPGELPIVTEPLTIRLGMSQSPVVEDFYDNKFTTFLQEKTGLTIEFDLYPENEVSQKVEVLIASGTKLPDAFIGSGAFGSSPDMTVFRHAQNGIFIPLDEYIASDGHYLLERSALAMNKDFMKYMTSPDGHVYALPHYQEQTSNTLSLRAYINTTWIDKLGLTMPETTDEFYEVIKAFVTQDPNGNGQADEIGILGRNTGHCQPHEWIMNAFIYDDDELRFNVQNGVIDVAYNKEQWREGLRFNHKLFEEGLFDPLTFTIDATAFKALVSAGDTNTIGLLGIMGMGQAYTTTQTDRKAEYAPIGPLKGPDGTQWACYYPPIPGPAMVITKDCENPRELFKFGDYLCSPEVALFSRFGEPGTDWVEPVEGDVALGAPWGAKPKLKAILVWGGSTSRSHWSDINPAINLLENSDGQVWNGDPTDAEYMIAQAVPLYQGKQPAEVCTRVIYTAEEMESIADIKMTLDSYVNESTARFISGDLDLDTDWDAYIQELSNIGLEEYISVTNQAYARMMQG